MYICHHQIVKEKKKETQTEIEYIWNQSFFYEYHICIHLKNNKHHQINKNVEMKLA